MNDLGLLYNQPPIQEYLLFLRQIVFGGLGMVERISVNLSLKPLVSLAFT